MSVAPRDTSEQQTKLPSRERSATTLNKGNVSTFLRRRIYQLAKLWMQLLSAVVSTIFLGIVSVVAGLNSPVPSPLSKVIHLHPITSIIVGALFMLFSFLAWFLSREQEPKDGEEEPNQRMPPNTQRWVTATIMSTASFMLCFILLAVVLIRPPGCPTYLCPPPILILNPHSIHDDNVEVYFQTLQSTSYWLPDDPTSYTSSNLPRDVSAQRIDGGTRSPYRVVLGVHSLQQGRFGLIIEQVNLVVKQVSLIPYPLRVWIENESRDYHSNLYQVKYRGQPAGTTLPATYTPLAEAHVQLIPGEADELDVEVISNVVIELHFQIQIAYRVSNEAQPHLLTLPNVFEIIFSNASNWQPYHLQGGFLVAGS